MPEIKTVLLFLLTAVAEIRGCYLPYLLLREGKSAWLLIPAALSLALFVWLLTLHPTAAGRVYAAYGGVYIFVAIHWLWAVDGIRPTTWDVVGSVVALVGKGIIMFGPRSDRVPGRGVRGNQEVTDSGMAGLPVRLSRRTG
jgi:small multidrug resistance family-3 protein